MVATCSTRLYSRGSAQDGAIKASECLSAASGAAVHQRLKIVLRKRREVQRFDRLKVKVKAVVDVRQQGELAKGRAIS